MGWLSSEELVRVLVFFIRCVIFSKCFDFFVFNFFIFKMGRMILFIL